MPDDRKVLEGVERLIVDGTNVLYALRRTTSQVPAAALIGRLRSIVPAGVSVIVVLDGTPQQGLVSRHVASGVEIRYAGRFTADEVIARLVEYEFAASNVGSLVVTDDIGLTNIVRRAGGRTARNGWLLARLDRQRLSAPAVGLPSSPSPSGPPAAIGRPGPGRAAGLAARRGGNAGRGSELGEGRGRSDGRGARTGPGTGAGTGPGTGAVKGDDEAPDNPGWAPGRGATRKVGNGRRRPTTGR